MNIEVERPIIPQPDGAIGNLLLKSAPDPRDETIAALEKELENLKNQYAEDKFLWFLGAIALFDVVALLRAENWTAPIVIGIIQLIAVIVMASRCKVDVVAPLIDKLVGMVPSFAKKSGDG